MFAMIPRQKKKGARGETHVTLIKAVSLINHTAFD